MEGNLNFFESPYYPNLYEDRLRQLSLLYIPDVQKICFSLKTVFGVESQDDELYIGSGLGFDFNDIRGEYSPASIHFFDSRSITMTGSPDDFCIESDTAWVYFLSGRDVTKFGWRLFWHVAGT